MKHVQSTDVLGGGVVCAANEDPARERKGFVVDRSWNVNVYASYGKKKFHDSYKEKRGTKTCDDAQKKGTKTCDERQNTEVKLVTRSKNAELKISLHVERVWDRTRNFDGQLDILSKQIIQLRAIKLVARARLVVPLKQRNRTTLTTDGELTLQTL